MVLMYTFKDFVSAILTTIKSSRQVDVDFRMVHLFTPVYIYLCDTLGVAIADAILLQVNVEKTMLWHTFLSNSVLCAGNG